MCNPTTLRLTATKTHATRRAHWSPLTGQLHDGTLTVIQGKREATSYLVQLLRTEDGDAVALLAKQAGNGDVYECRRVEVGWVCTCTGHCRHGHCKHTDAMAAVESELLIG